LRAQIRSGRFREDLYFRINVIAVEIPPLRARREEILPLLRHYTAYFAETFKTDVRGVTANAGTLAQAHGWPGNVRAFRNRVERAVAVAAGPWLYSAVVFPALVHREFAPETPSLARVTDAAQRQHIQDVLERAGGQMKKAAGPLGITRTTMWEKMRKLGLDTEDRGDQVRDS